MFAGREDKKIGSSTRLGYFANLFIQRRLFIITLAALVIIGLVLGFTFFYLNNAQGETDPAPTITNFAINNGATYANTSTRVVTASGIIDDLGGTGFLQVQFSEDSVNWGIYSGSGTINNTSTDWSYSTTVTASPVSQDIVSAWYLEDPDGLKTVFIRAKDSNNNATDAFSATFNDDFTAVPPGWYNDSATTTAEWQSGNIKLPTITSNVYVTDFMNSKVKKYDYTGVLIDNWGSPGSGDGQFSWLTGLALDSGENVFVADYGNDRIQKFDSSGNFVIKWGSSGTADGQFDLPFDVGLDSNNNVFVADSDNSRIQKFDSSGNFLTKWGTYGTGDGEFTNPTSVAFDSNDNLYVTDTGPGANRIQKFDSSGNFLLKWGTSGSGDGQFVSPNGVTVDLNDDIYVADSSNHRIQKFDSSGNFLTKWGTNGSGDSQFSTPWGIAVDAYNNVFVADMNNQRIQKFSSSGTFIAKWNTLAAGEAMSFPTGVAVSKMPPGSYATASNIAQSKTIDSTGSSIRQATLQATENNDPGTSVSYQLSRDGGQTWEDVTNGIEHTFTSTNSEESDLRWRATLAGTNSATPVIEDIAIAYNYKIDIVDTLTLDTTLPTDPSGLNATTVSTTQIDLLWVASDDSGGSGIAGYKIERALDNSGVPGTFTEIADTANVFYSDTSAAPNTKYWYRVLAYDNANNNSNYSFDISKETLTDPPTNALATDGTLVDKIEVSWTAPFTGADHYHIYKDVLTPTPYAETPNTIYEDTVTDADTHTYYIYSVNSEDKEGSGYTSDSGFRYIFLPQTPTMGTPQALSDTSIKWNFTDNSNNEEGFELHDELDNEIIKFPSMELSAGGGEVWTRERKLTTTNFQTNHQTKVTITYDTNMQPDFDDVRFYDKTSKQELPYWIERKTDSSTADIWFKTSTNNNIYLVYGNANASSSSNGDNTFKYFNPVDASTDITDDFDNHDGASASSSFDNTNDATDGSGSIKQQQGSVASINAAAKLRSKATYTVPIVIEWDEMASSQTSHSTIYLNGNFFLSDIGEGTGYSGATTFSNGVGFYTGSPTQFPGPLNIKKGSNFGSPVTPNAVSSNSWHHIVLKVGQNGAVESRIDGSVYSLDAGADYDLSGQNLRIAMATSTYSRNNSYWFDNVRIREYASIEPIVSVGNETIVSESTGPLSYDENSLLPNKQYARHVHAYNAAGSSAASADASTYTLPVAPNVSANKTTSTWYPIAYDVAFTNNALFGEGGVQYYRYVWNQNPTHAFDDTETQWSSSTLVQSTTSDGSWYLHVKSFNDDTPAVANGAQTYGPFNLDSGPPAVPTELSATSVSPEQIDLNWNASDDGDGSGVAGYKVQRALDVSGAPGTFSQIATSATNSFSDNPTNNPLDPPQPNTKYWYRVIAYDNVSNDSSPSADVDKTTLAEPPTNAISTDGTVVDQIDVSWVAPLIASEYDHFHIYKDSPTGVPITETAGTTFSDIVLDDAVHTYYIYAVNSNDVENPDVTSDSGYRGVIPNAPTMGAAQATSTSSIQWNFTDNSNNEDGFKVHDAAHNEVATVPADSASYTETSLSPNTAYTRHVHAYSLAADSAASANGNSMTFAEPPTFAVATDGTVVDQIDVSWVAPLIASEYDHFHIYKDSPTGIPIAETAGTTFSDIVLDDAVHTYYIYGVNSNDVENPLVISADGYRGVVPNAPTMGAAQAISTSSIQWNFTDNSNNEDGFKVHDAAHNEVATVPADSASYTETGLSPNTAYTRHVHAYSLAADSAASSDANRSTFPEAATLTSDTWYFGSNQVYVYWNASSAADHYHVYRDGEAGTGTLVFDSGETSFTDTVATDNPAYYIYAVNTDDVENPVFVTDAAIKISVPSSSYKIYGASDGSDDSFVNWYRTWVNDPGTYTNYPTNNALLTGIWFPDRWRSFLRFPVASYKNLPTEYIKTVRLFLREHPSGSSDCPPAKSQYYKIYHINPMNPGTDGAQTLWNTSNRNEISSPSCPTNDSSWNSFNVKTDFLEDLQAYDYTYYKLQRTGTDANSGKIYFVSSDYTGTSSDPYLEIIFAPAKPSFISLQETAADTVELTFKDESINENDFHFYVGTSPGTTTEYGSPLISTSKTTTGNTYTKTLNGLVPGSTYYIRIRAHDHTSTEYSLYSNELSFNYMVAPPTLNSIEPVASSLRTNITDNSISEADFHFYAGTSPNPDTEVATRVSTTKTGTGQIYNKDLGLNPNVRYYVRSKSHDHDYSLFSNYSNELSGYSGPSTPLAPTVSNPGDNKLSIAITSGDNNPLYTRYAIYNSTLDKYLQIDGTLGSEAIFIPAQDWSILGIDNTNLNADTSYSYKAQAMNEDNEVGPYGSESAAVRTLANTPIGASAVGIEDGIGGYDIEVSWNSGGAQTNYRAYSSSDSFGSIKYEGPSTSFDETGLDPVTTYNYRIYALNGDNVVNPDYASATSQKAALPLMAPSLLSLTADSETQLTATYIDKSTTEDDFHFYLDTTSPAQTDERQPVASISKGNVGDNYNKALTNLGPNTRYFLRSRAHNHTTDEYSAYSQEIVSYTKAQIPPPPSTEVVDSDKIRVTINPGLNPSQTKYAIYNNELAGYVQANGSVGPTPIYQTIENWGSEGIINTGLVDGTPYSYKAKAMNGDGLVTDFGASSTETIPSSPPTKPQMLLPTKITSTSITWNWRDNSYNEDGFVIHDSGETVLAQVFADTKSFTETNLSSDTSYSRHVHSFTNASGESQSSGEETARTLLVGPTQLDVEAEASPNTNVNISWHTPTSWTPTGYKVYRFTEKIVSANLDQATVVETTTETNYTDSGSGGEVFYYQVTAIDGSGSESDISTEIISDVANIGAPSPHGDYSQNTPACANCHRGHTGVAKALMTKNNEEPCYVCHDGTGSAYNIALPYKDKAAHDINISPTATSEVKCTNCHDAHGTDKPWALKNTSPDLCFTCHNSNLNTLNGWNIQSQFGKTSTHNVVADESSLGSGADGALVVDGTTATNSTDGQVHDTSNPYLIDTEKNFTTLIVQNNGAISVSPYDGSSGGQVLIKATENVFIDSSSKINVEGKGYRGGVGNQNGEGPGGGGGGNVNCGEAGGGAGHEVKGENGWYKTGGGSNVDCGGSGGNSYGNPNIYQPSVELGSGGGGHYLSGKSGGNGGGVVKIFAKELVIAGSVLADGQKGETNEAGSGSGGTIYLKAEKLNIDSATLTVKGGPRGTIPGGAGAYGGAGSKGYIHIDVFSLLAAVNCTNCHGPHTSQPLAGKILSDPDNTNNLWTGTKTDFCLKCHDNDPPKKSWLQEDFVPSDVLFPNMEVYGLFPGWDKTAYKQGGHNDLMNCTKCHDSHGSDNQNLRAYDYDDAVEYKEEGLCLKCHGPAGAELWKNFDAILSKPLSSTVSMIPDTTTTNYYKHPITEKADKHTNVEDEASLGSLSRHAECEDCHNPHENSPIPQKSAALAPRVYGAIKGAMGVDVTYGKPGKPLSFTPKAVEFEYELCFKCHSSYVDLPPDQYSRYGFVEALQTMYLKNLQDKAMEFNPSNPSFHPVTAAGKNLGIKDETFVEGTSWNPTAGDEANYNKASAKVYCTDCHGNNTGIPEGPHGSDNLVMLKAEGAEVCFRCHKQSVYMGSINSTTLGSRYNHSTAAFSMGTSKTICFYCHTAHGSVTNKHLMATPVYQHYEPGENSMPNGGGTITSCVLCHGSIDFTYEAAYK